MSRLQKGCYCLQLDVATSIIAIVGILGSILQVIHVLVDPNDLQPQTSADLPTQGNNNLFSLFGYGISLIVNCCLLAGVKTKNKNLLVPWLVVQMIGLFGITIFLVFAVITGQEPRVVAILLIINIINIHFIACVTSFYKRLEENEQKCAVLTVEENQDNLQV